MAKIKLDPEPTFNAKVGIPVPGKAPVDVGFTFKWRTAKEAEQWYEDTKELADVELIPTMASGWELDDAFNEENIARLCSTYMGAAVAITRTYVAELRGARVKN